MNQTAIYIESNPGEPIEDVVRRALRLAILGEQLVFFEFNGTLTKIDPKILIRNQIDEYWNLRK